MDGSSVEHSDSDSGESWSLVEHIPSYGDEVPDFPETAPHNDRNIAEVNLDKDEDTDGISIISDSDPEFSMPFDSNYTKCMSNPPVSPEYIPVNPLPPVQTPKNDELHEDETIEDDFLGDKNMKHKTYVHRRNKRLSTVLNIIVLGSVITAAGVAIGHMWGAKHECAINNTTPSVNKILSNLYKLQEENAYLRSKLKEFTLMSNMQIQRKSGTEKQNKCKKVFEESLNKIANKPTKCVDNGEVPKLLINQVAEPEREKDFLHDIDKLKQVYEQNKSWLDDEVSKRMEHEKLNIKRMKNDLNSKKKVKQSTQYKGDNFETFSEQPKLDKNLPESINPNISEDEERPLADRKISFADSLKSEQNMKRKIVQKRENQYVSNNKFKPSKNKDLDYDKASMLSEEEYKKDDRYVGEYNKNKKDKKKHDRQKLHNKQKRKNKYEQWEMKGGYLKDYDEFSVSSSQKNEYVSKNSNNKYFAKDVEKNNYIGQLSETDIKSDYQSEMDNDSKINPKENMNYKQSNKNGKNKEKETTWFEKRAVFRNEARKKLEHELFGETSPNNAGWYFQRMLRREQCRAKGENSTTRKLLKRNMNFKTKH